MTPKSKLFLAIAGGGLLVALGSKKKAHAAAAAEAEELGSEEDFPVIGPPVVVAPPPVQVPSLADLQEGMRGPDFMPPPKAIPEDPDAEESENPLPTVTVPLPGGGVAEVPVPKLPGPQPLPLPVPVPKLPTLPDVAIPPIRQVPATQEPATPDEPEQETPLPGDTANVLRILLARETASDWKRSEPILEPWQEARGLVVDGKFGPKSAAKMAEETGLLPIIRFWPKASQMPAALDAYRRELYAIAKTAEEPRRAQLLAATEREQGQGFGRNPLPITPTISI